MRVEKTERGFEIIRFKDHYGEECSLQQSSLAEYERPGTSAVWFGVGVNRMHSSFKQVKKILPHLESWVKNGSFSAGRVPR